MKELVRGLKRKRYNVSLLRCTMVFVLIHGISQPSYSKVKLIVWFAIIFVSLQNPKNRSVE